MEQAETLPSDAVNDGPELPIRQPQLPGPSGEPQPAAHTMQLKSPPPIASGAVRSFRTIHFRHPRYPASANPLLSLPALDNVPVGGVDRFGLDYDVALVACGIVANNRWHGASFSETPDGVAVTKPDHGLLLAPTYYFRVASTATTATPPTAATLTALDLIAATVSDAATAATAAIRDDLVPPPERYPVVPSFEEWQFPHGLPLPTCWPDIEVPDATDSQLAGTESKVACRITGSWITLQRAHIIPKAARLWFKDQQMEICSANRVKGFDDIRNVTWLRSDIHKVLDSAKFSIIPKIANQQAAAAPDMVIHAITGGPTPEDTEVRTVYHNQKIHSLGHTSREFLFARFAWALFSNRLAFRFLETPRTSFAVCFGDGVVEERTSNEIARPKSPLASDTGTGAEPSGKNKRRRGAAEAGDTGSDSDSDSGSDFDDTSHRVCVPPAHKRARVGAWLGSIEEAQTLTAH